LTDHKRKSKKLGNRIYTQAKVMIDEATGRRQLALVPRFASDLNLLRQRGFAPGDEIRADISKPRNLAQWRKAHLLAWLVRQHIDGFVLLTDHEALKRLQLESGTCCETEIFNIPNVGQLQRVVPQSLAFDEMDEVAFNQFYRSLCEYIAQRYWPGMTAEQIAQQAELMPSHPPSHQD